MAATRCCSYVCRLAFVWHPRIPDDRMPRSFQPAARCRAARGTLSLFTVRFWPVAPIPHGGRKRPYSRMCAAAEYPLDFSLFRNLQSVIHLDTKIPDRALQLGMPEQ